MPRHSRTSGLSGVPAGRCASRRHSMLHGCALKPKKCSRPPGLHGKPSWSRREHSSKPHCSRRGRHPKPKSGKLHRRHVWALHDLVPAHSKEGAMSRTTGCSVQSRLCTGEHKLTFSLGNLLTQHEIWKFVEVMEGAMNGCHTPQTRPGQTYLGQ